MGKRRERKTKRERDREREREREKWVSGDNLVKSCIYLYSPSSESMYLVKQHFR